jgi:hypothetical protein
MEATAPEYDEIAELAHRRLSMNQLGFALLLVLLMAAARASSFDPPVREMPGADPCPTCGLEGPGGGPGG